MKFKRSYSNARNLGSAYKFAFGGDINRAIIFSHSNFYTNLYSFIIRVYDPESIINSRGLNKNQKNLLLNLLRVPFNAPYLR